MKINDNGWIIKIVATNNFEGPQKQMKLQLDRQNESFDNNSYVIITTTIR